MKANSFYLEVMSIQVQFIDHTPMLLRVVNMKLPNTFVWLQSPNII